MTKGIGRKIGLAVLIILILGIAAVWALRAVYHIRRQMPPKTETFKGDSKSLKNTVILPTLDSPVIKGKNNIWCSTFHLAWNEMKNSVTKEPIKIQGAEELADRLNAGAQSKDDLSEDSYFIAAGFASEVITKIQTEMPQHFPSAEIPDFSGLSGDALSSYSYLDTYIKFKEPYRQCEKAFEFTDSQGNITPVSSFGVWEGYRWPYESLCDQVDLLYFPVDGYEHDGVVKECAIDLCRYSAPYQIVIAIVELEDTLQQTYDKLQVHIKEFQDKPLDEETKKFNEGDILIVSDMFWEISHHFIELEGKALLNSGYNMPIVKASQVIRFRLDRSGVLLESEAVFAASNIPRHFEFNRPFLLYLKKRDASQPFFVMWVDNAELLTAFQ